MSYFRTVAIPFLAIMGANIAYTAGAGFGTGQEVFQYFTSFGEIGLIGILISALLWITFDVIILKDTRKHNLVDLKAIYFHYCGKLLGSLLFMFSLLFLFLMTTLMISGAGALIEQYFGFNTLVGRSVMAIAAFTLAALGLKKAVDIIGSVGPALIILVILLTIFAILNPQMTIEEGSKFAHENDILSSSNNWLASALMYFSFSAFFRVAFINGLARKTKVSNKSLLIANIAGGIAFAFAVLLLIMAQLKNINLLYNSEVPNLVLSGLNNPVVEMFFGLLLFLLIFTTTVPLIWSVTDIVIKDDSKHYTWIVLLVTILALLAGGLADFSFLVNIITTSASYIGVLFFIPMLFVKAKELIEEKNK